MTRPLHLALWLLIACLATAVIALATTVERVRSLARRIGLEAE